MHQKHRVQFGVGVAPKQHVGHERAGPVDEPLVGQVQEFGHGATIDVGPRLRGSRFQLRDHPADQRLLAPGTRTALLAAALGRRVVTGDQVRRRRGAAALFGYYGLDLAQGLQQLLESRQRGPVVVERQPVLVSAAVVLVSQEAVQLFVQLLGGVQRVARRLYRGVA
ncbi:ORFL118C [Human betaherpesvirus 5]|nr:ORFL118C [Human betaherpesvirus 5]QHX40439.1 ORFL118C [Human betaherpesvirus 5]